MSDIQLYLLEVGKDKAAARDIAARSASKLERRELKLVDLITSLEDYINDKDDGGTRAKTVAFLADVLENVPEKVLSGQERRLLCDFVLGRIEGDQEGVGSSARVLSALEARGKWDPDTSQKVAWTFLRHVNPLKQVKLQTDRYAIIQLFDVLLGKYRIALKQVHDTDPEFLPAFISFVGGEKDPRNLMMIFSILLVPMAEWEIDSNAQDLFESVFNYFPVTFKPPPDDPYGITSQDLKDRLRDCIAANSDFAPYAFPELLDKLDSTSMNTKRDTLQAIQACVSGYGPNTVNLYSVTLWDALKFEILNVQEEDLAEASLTTLSSIASKFRQSDGPLNAYLRPIIKECNEHLEDAPTKQSQAAGRILYNIALASNSVADKIAKGVLPTLFDLHDVTQSLAKRRGLLEVFNQIVKAYMALSKSSRDVNTEALKEFTANALGAMMRALDKAPKSEVSLRLTALEGASQLVSIPDLLDQEDCHQVIDTVTAIVLHEQIEGHGNIRSESIKALTEMAHGAPIAIRDRAVPAFMVELPDVPAPSTAYLPVLEAFARLSSEHQVFDVVVRRLKNKLTAAKQQDASREYQQALLLALLYAFTYGTPMPDEEGIVRSSYFTDYVEPLIASLQDATNIEQDRSTLEIVGRMCNTILRPQSPHFQSSVYNKNLHWMLPIHGGAKSSPDRVRKLAPFSLYYYAALRPEVAEPDDVLSLLQGSADAALSSAEDSEETSIVLRHVALLVNKFVNPKAMETTLTSARIEVGSLLRDTPSAQATGLAFTMVKALLIQGKCPALTSQYLTLLLQLLLNSDKSTARHFAQLLAPDDILTKENHCTVSGLYKQKAFNQLVPSITTAIRTADATTKPSYLIALAGILHWLPYSMLEPSLPTLIPALLQTLDLTSPSDHTSKTSTLTIFHSILSNGPSLLSTHTASLITRLLNNTTGNVAAVRAQSLQCLALVPRVLEKELLMPFRRQVVKKLMSCLDDGRREVRAQGVRCRTAWLKLEEGEEDDD